MVLQPFVLVNSRLDSFAVCDAFSQYRSSVYIVVGAVYVPVPDTPPGSLRGAKGAKV